jgi:hypothetical protein
MTHSDAGRYADKHAPGRDPDEKIAAAVRLKARDGELSCASAEQISTELGAAMAEVGQTLDLLEVRINRCQLGLFGYPAEGKSVLPDNTVIPELEREIRSCLSKGKLPCTAAWGIAAERKIPRMKVSSACEALKIKIKPCQLGAF